MQRDSILKTKFWVKTRDIHKLEKKNYIGISVFGYENKVKYPIYVSKKCCEDKHVDLLLIGEGEKKHYVLIKDFNTFMYDHTLHCGRKHFCRYCLQAFRTAEKLKCHIKDCFKINGKQTINMPKKGEYIKFINFERKIKWVGMQYLIWKKLSLDLFKTMTCTYSLKKIYCKAKQQLFEILWPKTRIKTYYILRRK